MICPICHKDTLMLMPVPPVSNTGKRWILGYCTNPFCGYRDPNTGFCGESTSVDVGKSEEVELCNDLPGLQ